MLFGRTSGRTPQTASDERIRELEEDVRRLTVSERPPEEPPDAYWQNLAVRVNERIDRESSGRAISVAWAARVALPGIIAVVGVLSMLHYYAPETKSTVTPVSTVLLSLSANDLDSLLIDPSPVEPGLSVDEWAGDVFNVSREQIADYLVANGNASGAVDELTKAETTDLLASLESFHSQN
jgi:hypothetical protein